ncbi:MAG: hypothetical protein HZA27_03470 [Candidatus Omnitrophica bacterium]|nr:hypothetical protein [Candidatus Omnitrophota bacterium]
MYYDEVLRALNKNRVKFAIAGGVAVVAHGFTRFTADLDLIVELSKSNLEKFFDTLYDLSYRPKVPVTKEQFLDEDVRREWINKKGMVVFSFFHLKDHLKLIDMFVTEPIKFSEIEKKLDKIKKDDLTIPTVCIKHLKKLKLLALRPQDLIDIRNLEEIERIKNEDKKEN